MILGIGLDFVKVSRIAHWLEDPVLCKRYFQNQEMEDVYSRGSRAAESLAARFAAKEAFVKALGTGFSGLKLCDICVGNESNGNPYLNCEGSAKEKLDKLGANRVHLSLTHESDLAAAQVILEAI